MKKSSMQIGKIALVFLLVSLAACAGSTDKYRDQTMDFGSIKSVAVMPFLNLSKDQLAGDRVRDVFMTSLQATGGVYVIPAGEVIKGIGLSGIGNPFSPSSEEVVKLASRLKADAVITGVVREYGDIRSGSSTANVISVSLQMMEAQTGRVVWSTSVTKGGIGIMDRLLGGGGEPMNDITEKAVKELINEFYE